MKKLDLENVRIYSNTTDDILDAMDLIDEEVYMSNSSDFNTYDICNLFRLMRKISVFLSSNHFTPSRNSGEESSVK